MNTYNHSVSLDVEKCVGCTTCLRHCPTEAIRIRNGHAVINTERCIDCGECIRVCQHKAKKATYSKFDAIMSFKYKVALPAPALYGQFQNLDDIDYVLKGLLDIGFDYVYEVSQAAELVSGYTRRYMKHATVEKPVISSACPVVVRLISLRYPSLCDKVLPMLPPMEVAAMLARQEVKSKHPELSDGDIGICFISPCPAKVSYVNNSNEKKSNVDLVVSISDVYFRLIAALKNPEVPPIISKSGMIGIGWASAGGEATAIFNDKYLAADGIDNVIRVLEQMEDGKISDLDFVELNACSGGCVGGVLTVENPYIAKARLRSLKRYLPVSRNPVFNKEHPDDVSVPEQYIFDVMPKYTPASSLSGDIVQSIKMMGDIQKLEKELPGIDCGSCGAPTCHAFAEDIVKGDACADDCVIKMREKIKDLLGNEHNKKS